MHTLRFYGSESELKALLKELKQNFVDTTVDWCGEGDLYIQCEGDWLCVDLVQRDYSCCHFEDRDFDDWD